MMSFSMKTTMRLLVMVLVLMRMIDGVLLSKGIFLFWIKNEIKMAFDHTTVRFE